MDDIELQIKVVEYPEEGYHYFIDQFERSDRHIGGVTIKCDRTGEHFIPLQTSLAELTKYMAEQGTENPSRRAYETLKKDLAHYRSCYDVALQVTAFKCNVKLFEETGSLYDFSYEYYESLDDIKEVMMQEEGEWLKEEVLRQSRKKLKQLCENY